MAVEAIERDFKEKVSAKVQLAAEGLQRYRVLTPFLFEDGDHLAIILKHDRSKWLLSDEGHTYMHLTYDVDEKDLSRGTRQKIINNALSAFQVEDRDGELVLGIEDGRYGDALYSFAQALLKITDVSYLSRERVRSTFLEDFREIMTSAVPENRRVFDWNDPVHDPKGRYTVDCRVNGMTRPLFVFALPGDDRTRDSTIALLQFEKWGVPHRSLGIFEDHEVINRKVLARFTDVCEKEFSSVVTNRDRIVRYLEETMRDSS